SGQPLKILLALMGRPGELVTREELRGEIWPDKTFVDFEHGLHAAMNKLRRALNDSAEAPKYIETVPTRGYRFIGALTEEKESISPPVTIAENSSRASPAKLRIGAALAAIAIGLAATAIFWSVRRHSNASPIWKLTRITMPTGSSYESP